jgi:hypothetical protein
MNFINKGKKEIRIHHTLSNGQIASMYFTVTRNVRFADGYDYDCWSVGLRIGSKRRENNDWYNDDKVYSNHTTTGTCGLEGLLWAKDVLSAFTDKYEQGVCQMLIIKGDDNRRHRAYRRLMKEDGYTLGTYKGDTCYMLEF